MNRPYVGIRVDTGTREVFKANREPTWGSHGDTYIACIGPFRTMRGARFMAEHGRGNPHLQHVNDAERIAPFEVNNADRSLRLVQ